MPPLASRHIRGCGKDTHGTPMPAREPRGRPTTQFTVRQPCTTKRQTDTTVFDDIHVRHTLSGNSRCYLTLGHLLPLSIVGPRRSVSSFIFAHNCLTHLESVAILSFSKCGAKPHPSWPRPHEKETRRQLGVVTIILYKVTGSQDTHCARVQVKKPRV